MNEKISILTDSLVGKVTDIRRYLHTNPELSFCENNTMSYICKILDEIGVEYKSGVAGTGVVALIKGEKPCKEEDVKTLLLRADMDALPIEEVSDKPYKSKNNGVMHACGHDAHTAILLGVCEMLIGLKTEFSGKVKLVFQPGEETSGGAKPMIDEGILENPMVDACVALHVDPDIECGKIRIKPGSLYASPDDFKITVIGKGGHGAERHNCIDPISVSACVINELLALVDSEIKPYNNAVVTIGTIHGGTATNIIPDKVEITGTARSLTNDVRATLKKRIGEIACGVCKSHGAECEYEYIELFPPLINDENLSNELYASACKSIGEDNCIFGGDYTMAGEDFSYFSQKLPSVLFKLGCRNEGSGITEPLHSPYFDIDETAIKYGMMVFTGFVLDYLL